MQAFVKWCATIAIAQVLLLFFIMQKEKEEKISLEEQRIRKAFKDRDWNEIKIADSWTLFKVMGEFVNGFEKLSKIGLK